MQIICNKHNQALVMTIKGRMDRPASADFDKTFSDWVAKGERFFVVDMNELEYISSAGLRSFLTASQQLKENKGCFRLCNVSGLAREILVVSGFESIFSVYNSLANAVKMN